MFNLNMFNLKKNLTKSRNFIIACLTISLFSSNLLNAGWQDWFGTAKTAAVEFSTEHPVKAGCAIGVTTAVGAHMLDRRACDDRASWGTVALLGATIGVAAWYKFTSDREANLKAAVAKNFATLEKQAGAITAGIADVTESSTATGAALASASLSVAENGAALTAAQVMADTQAQATAVAKTSIENLITDFTALNDAAQKEILERLTASGLTLEQALARVNTSDLSDLLHSLGISQAGLSAQCTELARQAQEAARQVELVRKKLARLQELEKLAQLRTDTATTT